MDWTTLKSHLFDFGKGFLGAVAAAAAVAAVNYLGAHLPMLISFVLTWIGAVVGVKVGKS